MSINLLHDIRQFVLTIPGRGTLQAYPANDYIEYDFKKENNHVFFRKHLKTSLNFVNDGNKGIEDFDALYAFIQSSSKCEKILLEVKKYCGAVWSTEWTGYISRVDMDVNVSGCTISVEPRIEDDYTDLLEDGKNEVNLLNADGDDSVSVFYGTIQLQECLDDDIIQRDETCSDFNEDYVTNCLVSGEEDTWSLIEHHVTITNDSPSGDPYERLLELQTIWAREFSDDVSMPSGSGWIAVVGGWARPAPRTFVSESTCSKVWRVPFYDTDLGDLTIDNGVSLRSALIYIADRYGLTFASDFFNMNAVGDAPNNVAYQNASAAGLFLIMLAQITDVARPDTDQNATQMNAAPLDFLDNLCKMFNCGWHIDSGVLRVEHISFYQGRFMLDLTSPGAVQFINGKFRYKYKNDKLPKKEEFFWSFQTDKDGDFDGLPIEYSGACVGVNQTTEEISCPLFVTNVEYIQANSEDFESSNEIVLIHRSAGLILFAEGHISGEQRLNGHLSWSDLHDNYYKFNRPALSGKMNGEETEFFQVRKSKTQDEITVMMTCADLNTFDPADQVKSQLGWCSVESAAMKIPDNTIKLKLIHE